MANRFPLIVDTEDGNRLKEIPSGDSLDFSSVGIANLTSLSVGGSLSSSTIATTGNVSVGGTLNVTGVTTLDSATITALTVSGTINGAAYAAAVQSDWNIADTGSLAFIKNKPTINNTVASLNDIGDVGVPDPDENDILSWNGVEWRSIPNVGGLNITQVRQAVSVTQTPASGTGSLGYDDTTGVFTYTPPSIPANVSDLVNDSNFVNAAYLDTNNFLQQGDIITGGRIGSTVAGGQVTLSFDETGLLTAEADTLETVVQRGATSSVSIEVAGITQNLGSALTNSLKLLDVETLDVLTAITSTNGTITSTNGDITATNGNITAGANLSGAVVSGTTRVSTPLVQAATGFLALESPAGSGVQITNGVINFSGIIPASPNPGDLWSDDFGMYFRATDDGFAGNAGGTDTTYIIGGPGTGQPGQPGMIIPYFEDANKPANPSFGEMYINATDTIAYVWDSTQWRALW